MSVRSRLTILISMIFIFVTILSTLVIFRESSEILNGEAEIRMEEQLNRANENVSLLLQKIALETEHLSRDQRVIEFLMGNQDQEDSDKYLHSLREDKNKVRPVYMDLFITNLDGTIVSASMEEALNMDTSIRSYYIDAKASGKTATGDVIHSRADNAQIVITLTPVKDHEVTIGYAGIAIHATYFSQFLEDFEIHNGNYIILDSEGKIISHRNKVMITKPFDFFQTNNEDFYTPQKVTIEAEEYLVQQKPLGFKDWQIISYLKTDEIYSKSRELSITFFILGSVFIVIGIGLSLYITNYVTKPIVGITDTINKIIEEEKQYKETIINKIPLHRLEEVPAPEAQEISEFRKAITGFKNILDRGADQFELQNTQLKDYIHTMDQELKNINNRNLEFIQTLSHDIRTPLTLIKGYASGLNSGEVQDDEMKERFQTGIIDSANNLEYLIYDVLDYAYEINDKHIFNKKEYTVEEFTKKTTFKIKQLYQERAIDIEIDTKDSNQNLFIDRMQINRVIINLINNSIKYSDKENQIKLSIVEERDHLSISVYDEGIGIKEEDLNNIYDMFYRGENKGDSKGYGLGLYISSKILKGHDSRLICDSKENEYTNMSFVLRYGSKEM